MIRPFGAGKVALIGLSSFALAAHLWMQVDGHVLSSADAMDGSVKAGSAHSPSPSEPATQDLGADMAMLCLAVISGFAIGVGRARPWRSLFQLHTPVPRSDGYGQVVMVHPPWIPRSLFARSVSLLH